jgi:hypothetical protein
MTEGMKNMLNGLRDKMNQETERFLAKALRKVRDPRKEYEQFVRELESSEDEPVRMQPAITRPAA